MPINAITQTYADILRVKAERPTKVFSVADGRVITGGSIWRGTLKPSQEEEFDLLALTSPDSWAEVSWSEPSAVVGIQFAGNQDDGWARILVDGEKLWESNTFGVQGKFHRYVEFSGLDDAPHTVRVEVVGRIGTEGGGIDVSLTAFGLGKVSAENQIDNSMQIFMPFVASGSG